MKHVTGFPNLAGTRITAIALSRVQSRTSGVTAAEQNPLLNVPTWAKGSKVRPGPITTDRHCRGNAERGLLALAAVAMHREVLLSVGFSRRSTKKLRARPLRADVYSTSAKSRSVPGQSVKTGSSPTAMRRLFGDVRRLPCIYLPASRLSSPWGTSGCRGRLLERGCACLLPSLCARLLVAKA